ncbi:hypothetical protein FACS1894187_02180 [Synergistales bacterium]|nr:hypothetical protein FACS1894187_02180 [Synergistales bacterium]
MSGAEKESKAKLAINNKTKDDNLHDTERLDNDNLWKIVIHRFFWDALKIFLPELYEAADRGQKPEFLEQELQKVTFDLGGGANRTDLLVQIKLRNGEDELILCHIEVQGSGGEGDLPTRMYRYKSLIYLKHQIEPVGIAVITDSRPKGEKTFYHSERFGVESLYKYVNVVVSGLEDSLLLSEDNRVGLVLYAAKCKLLSGDDESKKFRYLRDISKLWLERGWDREDKRLVLLAVDYLMKLAKDYREQIFDYVETLAASLEEGKKAMYVSIFEEVYTARGVEQGIEKGRLEGQAEVARNLLNDGLPVEKVAQYTTLPREEVERLRN